MFGTAFGVLVGLAGVVWWWYDPLPKITEQRLQQAERKWLSKDQEDYTCQINLTGSQTATYFVQVKDGQPVAVTNEVGRELPRRTWDAWTIPGLFENMARELESCLEAESPLGTTGEASVLLRAAFDPEWGFPVRYRRAVLGSDITIAWKISDFQPASGTETLVTKSQADQADSPPNPAD